MPNLKKKTHFRHRFNIIGDKGGLYGRSSRSIYIAPFNLSEVLDNLCKFDFIRKHSAYGKKEKGSIYRLTDLFSLYFLKFIGKKTGLDEHYWTNIKESARNSWCGYAFEQVCLHHIGFVAVEQIQISSKAEKTTQVLSHLCHSPTASKEALSPPFVMNVL